MMLTLLNQWGGVISLIGLIFSIVIFAWTGNIKKNLRKNIEYKTYKVSKNEPLRNLQSLIDSLEQDDLMDWPFQVELLREVNKLLKCKGFVDFTCRNYIWQLNRTMKMELVKYDILFKGKLKG